MKHAVPHDLPKPLAKKAADAALQAYSARFAEYNPQITWTDEDTAEVCFKAKGITLKGTFEIHPGEVCMDMEVPLLLRPFRQKAMDVVEGEIRTWIGRAKAGEL